MNTKIVRQLLAEVAILKEAIKVLYTTRKEYSCGESDIPGLCSIIGELLITDFFFSPFPYCFKQEFFVYRGSDNPKIQAALKMSEYTRRHKKFKSSPNTTFMWNQDIYGWQYRVMFCEGLIEEKTKEVQSRLNNCSRLFRLYVYLLTGIKKSQNGNRS